MLLGFNMGVQRLLTLHSPRRKFSHEYIQMFAAVNRWENYDWINGEDAAAIRHIIEKYKK